MSTLYKIKLQNFEGPLDLLLFFVRKDELNIYDIPLARITKSYLEYLQLMQDLNLDIASEFILMAATLMRIKVKMMLPKDPIDEEEEELMDPREELSRRLIEYRQFKEASKSLSELDAYWRQVYRRSLFNFDLIPQNEEEVIGLKDISFFDLLAAYKKALEKKPIPVFHNVERLNVTVEDQQKYIMDFFRDRNCYLFTELCDDMAKIEIVVTFLALLDLVKRAEIAIKQASIFDDIWIYKASEFKDEAIPENERADADIEELTNPVEMPQELIEIEPAATESEYSIYAELAVTETVVTEASSEIDTPPAEIEIEFIKNESKTVDVYDQKEQESAKIDSHEIDLEVSEPESPILMKGTEQSETGHDLSNNDVTESELATGFDAADAEPSLKEKEILTELHFEAIVETMTDESRPGEIPVSHAVEDPQLVEFADTGALNNHPAELSDIEMESETEEAENNMAIGGADVVVAHSEIADDASVLEEPRDDVTEMKRVESLVHERDGQETALIKTESYKHRDAVFAEPLRMDIGSTQEKKPPEEKRSRWKNFFNKIVSIVRKIFYK